jgi:hypothetical protein
VTPEDGPESGEALTVEPEETLPGDPCPCVHGYFPDLPPIPSSLGPDLVRLLHRPVRSDRYR